jgi:hypothetical protein
VLQGSPPAVGPALPLQLRAALQAAAEVLTQQGSWQFQRNQSAAIRAVDTVMAEYAR